MSLLFPVFPVIPDFETAPRYSVGGTADKMAVAPAEAFVTFPTTEPERIFGFSFVLDTRAEILALKSFFSERGGRCRPFYLPSWRDDLTIQSGSGDSLVVDPVTIPEAHGDHFSRAVFVYHEGAVHVTRWIRATTTGTETTFQLEDALPWTVTPGEDMAGWAHLARFADDRLAWKHRLPDCAELTIAFRAGRHWTGVPTSGAVEPLVFSRSPGFAAFAAVEDALAPIDYRVAYAMGPATLHTAGALNSRWAAWPDASGAGIRLKKTAGGIIRPDGTGTLSSLTGIDDDAERLALAFDHAGNEYIAFQDGATISVHWLDGTERFEDFTGLDPVLANNFFTDTGMPTGEAEVVCFYRKPGANVLFARYASDDFAEEHVAALLPFAVMELRGLAESDWTTLLFADAAFRLATLSTP